MFKITFSSGEVCEANAPLTVYEAAQPLGILSREILAAEVNGTVTELSHTVDADAEVKLLTFRDAEGARVFRHTAAHVMAQAVKRLYPDTKQTIGPATENGYFQDFDSPVSFTPDILKNIEAEMKKIVKENLRIERFVLPKEEALKLMRELDEPYKVERIEELPEDAVISFYRQGEYVDLCAGPHLFSTGMIKAFKLTQCTGAYYKGDQNNKMLQRVYGIAFPTKDELNAYVTQQEEALKRDHNKIGRELEFFTTVDTVGQGLPFFFPRAQEQFNFFRDGLRTRKKEEDIFSQKLLLWLRESFIRFPVTGTTILTECSFLETPTTIQRIALRSVL